MRIDIDMRPLTSLLIALFWVSTLSITTSVAENSAQLHLPEGARARLGKGTIREIAYSPDGRHLAVAGGIGIWLYDTTTFQEVDLFTEHTHGALSVSFSADGSMIASGGGDATVRLWDATTGTLRNTLTGRTSEVFSVSLSADGSMIASGGGDATVRLWDATTGTLRNTLTGRTSEVFSVSFSADGSMIASGGGDATVRLWDATTGTLRNTLTGHTSEVTSVSFSPDGGTIASGSRDRTVRLWDATTGTLINTLKNTSGESISFSADGNTLATGGSYDATVRLWDATTGTLINRLKRHPDLVSSVSFSPDGSTIASGDEVGTVLLWDATTGTLTKTLTGHTNKVTSVSFSADGNTLASGSQDGTVLLWDLAPTPPAPESIAEDVNKDSVVNIQDLVAVAAALGQAAAAPSAIRIQATAHLTLANVQHWLIQAQQLDIKNRNTQRGILFLQSLLAVLTPKEMALLQNYPNPFNPETWIPYQLTAPAEVSIAIYTTDGKLVRTLTLGHQPAGIYASRSRAAAWDGKNALGEPVASGMYFYTLTAGNFTATRKMLIAK